MTCALAARGSSVGLSSWYFVRQYSMRSLACAATAAAAPTRSRIARASAGRLTRPLPLIVVLHSLSCLPHRRAVASRGCQRQILHPRASPKQEQTFLCVGPGVRILV